MTLGQHRRERLLSVRDLAKEAGVSTSTITRAEQGIGGLHPRTMKKISEALGVPAREVAEFARALDGDRAEEGV